MKLNEKTQLFGKACVLVPYEAAMVPRYHLWMQDAELLELTGSEPVSLEDEYKMQVSWREDNDKLTFVVLDRAREADPELGPIANGGAMAGDVNMFFNANTGDAANCSTTDNEGACRGRYAEGEIEIMIAEVESRRRGLAKEALTMMMDYCTRELGTTAFVAKIKDHNDASVALFSRLGFMFEKKVPVFGEVVYRLERTHTEAVLVGADGAGLDVLSQEPQLVGPSLSETNSRDVRIGNQAKRAARTAGRAADAISLDSTGEAELGCP